MDLLHAIAGSQCGEGVLEDLGCLVVGLAWVEAGLHREDGDFGGGHDYLIERLVEVDVFRGKPMSFIMGIRRGSGMS